MTQDEKEKLQKLIEKWRKSFYNCEDPAYGEGHDSGMKSAADDLEFVLENM